MLVDVTPSAPERHTEMTEAQKGTVALVQGDRTFPSFDAMLDVTVAAAPHRDRKSLRRGVFHNSKRLDDGTWTWRYDSFRKGEGFDGLWDDVPAITTPTTLVRGANSFFVNDEDADEFARIAPGFQRVHVVADSGHSVQSDQPATRRDLAGTRRLGFRLPTQPSHPYRLGSGEPAYARQVSDTGVPRNAPPRSCLSDCRSYAGTHACPRQ